MPSTGRERRAPRQREPLDAGAVAIYHPACGTQVLLTHVGFGEIGVRIEAICPRCDRYVFLLWGCADPVAGDLRARETAGPEVAPRADMSSEHIIEELETLLTVEYVRLWRARRPGRDAPT